MGHQITALIIKGNFDKSKAEEYDLFGKDLGFDLSLFHVDQYYSAYWQYKLLKVGQLEIYNIKNLTFPSEIVLSEIVRKILNNEEPKYAIIQTEHFGGNGKQFANAFVGSINADKNISTINQALKYLGVQLENKKDEFEEIGLDKIRIQPEYLKKYIDLTEKHGVLKNIVQCFSERQALIHRINFKSVRNFATRPVYCL